MMQKIKDVFLFLAFSAILVGTVELAKRCLVNP